MKFALIICTFERATALLRLLNSVKRQEVYPDEILIIDGSLSHNTKKALKEYSISNLDYYYVQTKYRGLTKQRNFGISKLSSGLDIAFFLDDDVVLEPHYFENILNTYRKHPEALGVGGYIIDNKINWHKVENTTVLNDEFEYEIHHYQHIINLKTKTFKFKIGPDDRFYNNSEYEDWYTTEFPNGDVALGMKDKCERVDMGNSTWIVDTEMSEEECGDVPDLPGQGVPGSGDGGWWFEGFVAGVQFYIAGAELTDMYGGTAGETFGSLLSSNSDCDGDGDNDEGCNMILSFDVSGGLIAPSDESQLLVTLAFEDFNGIGICFGGLGVKNPEDSGWSPPVFSAKIEEGEHYADGVFSVRLVTAD